MTTLVATDAEYAVFGRLDESFGGYEVTRGWIPKSQVDAITARPGKILAKPSKVIIGDTGYRGLTAERAANDRGQAYGHFIVDHEKIIECVPALTSRAGLTEQSRFVEPRAAKKPSAQDQAIDPQISSIAVNLCFGGDVKADRMFERCVGLVAYLCAHFALKVDDVQRAADVDVARNDPDDSLRAAGKTFEELKEAAARVKEAAAAKAAPQTSATPALESTSA